MRELQERLARETDSYPPVESVCQGTLLSKAQYQSDMDTWGFKDTHLIPIGKMTADDFVQWETMSLNPKKP